MFQSEVVKALFASMFVRIKEPVYITCLKPYLRCQMTKGVLIMTMQYFWNLENKHSVDRQRAREVIWADRCSMNNGVKIQITNNSNAWRIIEMNTTENMSSCFQLYQLFEKHSLNYLIKLHKNHT